MINIFDLSSFTVLIQRKQIFFWCYLGLFGNKRGLKASASGDIYLTHDLPCYYSNFFFHLWKNVFCNTLIGNLPSISESMPKIVFIKYHVTNLENLLCKYVTHIMAKKETWNWNWIILREFIFYLDRFFNLLLKINLLEIHF